MPEAQPHRHRGESAALILAALAMTVFVFQGIRATIGEIQSLTTDEPAVAKLDKEDARNNLEIGLYLYLAGLMTGGITLSRRFGRTPDQIAAETPS